MLKMSFCKKQIHNSLLPQQSSFTIHNKKETVDLNNGDMHSQKWENRLTKNILRYFSMILCPYFKSTFFQHDFLEWQKESKEYKIVTSNNKFVLIAQFQQKTE